MLKRSFVLVLTVISALAFALPALAKAEDESLHLLSNFFPATGAISGGETKLTTGGFTVKCTKVSGSISFESGTTGKLHLTSHGCTGPLGVTCTSEGQSAGTITTTDLPFHLVTLPINNPGILVTPGANEHFATFTCFGVQSVFRGNGLVGTITSPQCQQSATTATINFEQSANGLQRHRTVSGTSTFYNMNRNFAEEAALSSSLTVSFGELHFIVCT